MDYDMNIRPNIRQEELLYPAFTPLRSRREAVLSAVTASM